MKSDQLKMLVASNVKRTLDRVRVCAPPQTFGDAVVVEPLNALPVGVLELVEAAQSPAGGRGQYGPVPTTLGNSTTCRYGLDSVGFA